MYMRKLRVGLSERIYLYTPATIGTLVIERNNKIEAEFIIEFKFTVDPIFQIRINVPIIQYWKELRDVFSRQN